MRGRYFLSRKVSAELVSAKPDIASMQDKLIGIKDTLAVSILPNQVRTSFKLK